MVKAWRELVTIPTYEIGKAEKNPIFLEKRVYQGSSGTFWIYSAICMCAFVFLWNRCPETKGKSLEELEKELIKG